MAFKNYNNLQKDNIEIYSFSSNTSYLFPMFLTEFNDQRSSNWSSQEIYGRMDPIYTYKNTTRKISIGFDVISNNREAAEIKFLNIRSLQDSLYPIYDEREGELGAANLSSPPLFRVKITNLLNSRINSQLGCLGWIDNFNFKPEFDSGFFTAGDSVDAKEQVTYFPKLLKISFTFNVIHEYPLGFRKDHTQRITTTVEIANLSAASQGTSTSAAGDNNSADPNQENNTPPPPASSTEEAVNGTSDQSIPSSGDSSNAPSVKENNTETKKQESENNNSKSDVGPPAATPAYSGQVEVGSDGKTYISDGFNWILK